MHLLQSHIKVTLYADKTEAIVIMHCNYTCFELPGLSLVLKCQGSTCSLLLVNLLFLGHNADR